MSAGLAPPTHITRFLIALVAAFAIAIVLPVSSTLAQPGPTAASDEDDGGKKKDKSDRKSKERDSSSKDDDNDDEDEDDDRTSKSKKSDDDDSDDDDSDENKSDDDDSDDDDSDENKSDDDAEDDDSGKVDDRAVLSRTSDDASRGSADPAQATEPAPKPVPAAEPAPATAAAGSLLATRSYLPMADAIARARKAGGQGDVLQIDLEYDAFRGFATCDVTFSSGTEYEMNAETGEILGEKQKDPNKLALLAALSTEAKDLKSFTDIIDQVVKATGQAVLEMELKHLKGQPAVIFEVVTADGITSHFDATTGKPAPGV